MPRAHWLACPARRRGEAASGFSLVAAARGVRNAFLIGGLSPSRDVFVVIFLRGGVAFSGLQSAVTVTDGLILHPKVFQIRCGCPTIVDGVDR